MASRKQTRPYNTNIDDFIITDYGDTDFSQYELSADDQFLKDSGFSDEEAGKLKAAADQYNRNNPSSPITVRDIVKKDRSGIMGGIQLLGEGIYDAFSDTLPDSVARMWRGGDISPDNRGWTDDVIARQRKDQKARIPSQQEVLGDTLATSLYQGPQSMATSLATGIGGAVIGGAAGSAVPGIGNVAGAAIGAGAATLPAFYRMAKDQFVEEIQERVEASLGRRLTADQAKELNAAIDDDASKFGLWEAGPEALSQVLTAGLVKGAGGAVLRKFLPAGLVDGIAKNALTRLPAKLAADIAGEEATEAATFMGQEGLRKDYELRYTDPTLGEFAREQAGPVAVGAGLQMGAMGGVNRLYEHYRGKPGQEPTQEPGRAVTPQAEEDDGLVLSEDEGLDPENLPQQPQNAAEAPPPANEARDLGQPAHNEERSQEVSPAATLAMNEGLAAGKPTDLLGNDHSPSGIMGPKIAESLAAAQEPEKPAGRAERPVDAAASSQALTMQAPQAAQPQQGPSGMQVDMVTPEQAARLPRNTSLVSKLENPFPDGQSGSYLVNTAERGPVGIRIDRSADGAFAAVHAASEGEGQIIGTAMYDRNRGAGLSDVELVQQYLNQQGLTTVQQGAAGPGIGPVPQRPAMPPQSPALQPAPASVPVPAATPAQAQGMNMQAEPSADMTMAGDAVNIPAPEALPPEAQTPAQPTGRMPMPVQPGPASADMPQDAGPAMPVEQAQPVSPAKDSALTPDGEDMAQASPAAGQEAREFPEDEYLQVPAPTGYAADRSRWKEVLLSHQKRDVLKGMLARSEQSALVDKGKPALAEAVRRQRGFAPEGAAVAIGDTPAAAFQKRNGEWLTFEGELESDPVAVATLEDLWYADNVPQDKQGMIAALPENMRKKAAGWETERVRRALDDYRKKTGQAVEADPSTIAKAPAVVPSQDASAEWEGKKMDVATERKAILAQLPEDIRDVAKDLGLTNLRALLEEQREEQASSAGQPQATEAALLAGQQAESMKAESHAPAEGENTPSAQPQGMVGLPKREEGADGTDRTGQEESARTESGLEQGNVGPDVRLPDGGTSRGAGERNGRGAEENAAEGRGHARVKIPSRADEPVTFRIMEAGDVQASHLPGASFQKNPKYAFENERRYHDEPASQGKVLQNAQNLDPSFLLESVDANHGAPVVDREGNVLGGNGRAMSISHAYEKFPDKADAYRAAIRDHAASLGINPSEVDAMQRPVLVRQLDRNMSHAERQDLLTALNDTFTDSKNARASGKSRGDRLGNKTLNALGKGLAEADSLRQFFDEPESAGVVEMLIDDGVIQKTERNAYVGPDGLLNPDGKRVVEEALRGRVARSYDALASLPGAVVAKIDAAIPHLLVAESVGGEWNITGHMRDAIDLLSEYQGGNQDVAVFLNQANMLKGGKTPRERYSPAAVAMFQMALDAKKKDFASAFAKFASAAKISTEAGGLPGIGKTAQQAAKDYLGIELDGKQKPAPGQTEKPQKTSELSEDEKAAALGTSQPKAKLHAGGKTAMKETGGDVNAPAAEGKPGIKAEQRNPSPKIEDFGEKIGGARKDTWQALEAVADASDDDITTQPLSKLFPEPKYQQLIDEGANPRMVAFVHTVRDLIATEKRHRRISKRTLPQLRIMLEFVRDVVRTPEMFANVEDKLNAYPGLKDKLASAMDLYEAVGHEGSLADYRLHSGAYTVFFDEKFDTPTERWLVEKKENGIRRTVAKGKTKEEALKEFKEQYKAIAGDKGKAAKKPPMIVTFYNRSEKGLRYRIGVKVRGNIIELAGPFDTTKDAAQYAEGHKDELFARAERIKSIPSERRSENAPRVGTDYRQGKDVTPKQFSEAFGFRGVEFGNWVEGDRRQADLNEAYDALMDLAGALGVSPKALSLNGELGLAFGARGRGGNAKAHYEPGHVVINLTKTKGAGSLAHEWLHALDNYFSRMAGKEHGYLSDDARGYQLKRSSKTAAKPGELRDDVIDAWANVRSAIRDSGMHSRSQALDALRSSDYWSQQTEMAARAFEAYIIDKLRESDGVNDYLANIVSEEGWKNIADEKQPYPYPTQDEVPSLAKAFDTLFDVIEERETDKGVALASLTGGRFLPPRQAKVHGASLNRVQHVADMLNRRAKNAATSKAVQSFDDLPASITEEFADARDTLEGAYDPDSRTVYLVADNLSDPRRAAEVWAHEQLVHHGLRDLLKPEERKGLLTKLFLSIHGMRNETVREVAGRYGVDQRRGVADRLAVMEEVVATLAEKRGRDLLNTAEQGVWRRIVDAVRRMWDRIVQAVTGRTASMQTENIDQLLSTLGRHVVDGIRPSQAQEAAGLTSMASRGQDSLSADVNGYGIPMDRVTAFERGLTPDEVKAALSALAGRDLHNDLENIDAQVNSDQREKLISKKAADKSYRNGFSYGEHDDMVSKVERLWRWAALAQEKDDRGGNPDSKIQRYVAAVRIGNNDGFAWLTVKKTASHGKEGQKDAYRIYSLELMNEKKLREMGEAGMPNGKPNQRALSLDKLRVKEETNLPIEGQNNPRALSFDDILAKLRGPVNDGSRPLAALSSNRDRANLDRLIEEWNVRTGLKESVLRKELREYFGVEKVSDIPTSWMPEAEAFVQDKLDAIGPEEEQGTLGRVLGMGAKDTLDAVEDNEELKRFVDTKDMGALRAAFALPHWLAKKWPSFAKFYNRQIERRDERASAVKSSLEEIPSLFGKNRLTAKDRESLRDLIWSIEGQQTRRERISKTEHFSTKETLPSGRDLIKVNPEFYKAFDLTVDEADATPAAKKAMKEIRRSLDNDFVRAHNRMANMSDMDDDAIKQLRQDMEAIPNYFPHHRYGRFYLQAKVDGKVLYRAHFDANELRDWKRKGSLAQRTAKKLMAIGKEELKNNLAANYPGAKVEWKWGENKALPDAVLGAPIDTQAMEQIIDAATRNMTNKEQAKEVAEMLKKYTSDILKARGWGAHSIKRQNIPGFEKGDIERVLYDYKSGLYGWLSKLDAAHDFGSYLGQIDARRQPELWQYCSRYTHDMLRNSDATDRMIGNIKALFFYWYLGGSLKTAAINATQNLVVGVPRLEMDVKRGGAVWLRAAGHALADAFKKGKFLEGEEAQVIRELWGESVITDNYMEEVRGHIAREIKGAAFLNKAAKILGAPMAFVERFNRTSLALAAFRAARAGNLKPAALERMGLKQGEKPSYVQAKDFAKDVVQDSHFVYGKSNMPEVLRGDSKAGRWASTAYTFRSFSANMVGMWDWALRTQGAAGRWFIAKSIGATIGLGGLTAFPFYATLSALFTSVTGDDEDWTAWVRRHLPKDDMLRDLACYGVPSLAGFYVGGSLQMETPITKPLRQGAKLKDIFEDALWNATGIPGAMVEQMSRAYEAAKAHNPMRAMEEASPVFMKNAMAAWRLATEGQRGMKGRAINETGTPGARTLSTYEATGKALGFQPLSNTRSYEKYAAKKLTERVRAEKVEDLAYLENKARETRDPKYRAQILQEIREWNRRMEAHDKPSYQIHPKDVFSRANRARQENRPTPKNIQRRDEERAIFGQ